MLLTWWMDLHLAHVAGQRISLSGADRGLDDRPNSSLIIIPGKPDQHGSSHERVAWAIRT